MSHPRTQVPPFARDEAEDASEWDAVVVESRSPAHRTPAPLSAAGSAAGLLVAESVLAVVGEEVVEAEEEQVWDLADGSAL